MRIPASLHVVYRGPTVWMLISASGTCTRTTHLYNIRLQAKLAIESETQFGCLSVLVRKED